MDNSRILEKFPRIRIELPEEYRRIYEQHYLDSREGQSKTTSLVKRLETWLHKKVAEDVAAGGNHFSTLEIGSGTLNHLAFEPVSNSYDAVEPFALLYQQSPMRSKVRRIFGDIMEIDGVTYDRIISIATFEHVTDLPAMVAKAATLLNEKGHLRVSVPNEGTILWRLGTYVTGFAFRKKYGLDYQLLMRYEHINTAGEIEEVLRYFFRSVRVSVLGLNRKLAFYRFCDCRDVIEENLAAYLRDRK
jgi:hypothetical protein